MLITPAADKTEVTQYTKWTQLRRFESDICYVIFPTEGYGGNLNFEKNEKEGKSIILKFEILPLIVQ